MQRKSQEDLTLEVCNHTLRVTNTSLNNQSHDKLRSGFKLSVLQCRFCVDDIH